MTEKEKEIKNLIRDDYGFPIFQELLAELIYETQKYNHGAMSRRYDSAIKSFLGKPEPASKKDEIFQHDLREVAALSQKYSDNRKDEKSVGEAAATVARERIMKNYKRGDPIPKDLSDQKVNEIAAYTRKLKRELEKILLKKVGGQNSLSWEQKDKMRISVKTLCLVAEGFGMSPSELMKNSSLKS